MRYAPTCELGRVPEDVVLLHKGTGEDHECLVTSLDPTPAMVKELR